MAIFAIVWTLIIAAAGYAAMVGYFSSGGTQPTITITSQGCHYSSPLHGGYSFDCPSGYRPINLSNASPVLGAVMQNELISMAMISNAKNSGMMALMFQPRKAHQAQIQEDCDIDTLDMQASGRSRVDLSEATAEFERIGALEGCYIGNAQDSKGDEIDLFVSDSCSKTHTLVMFTQEDISGFREFIGSVRCGRDAK